MSLSFILDDFFFFSFNFHQGRRCHQNQGLTGKDKQPRKAETHPGVPALLAIPVLVR